MEEDVGVSCRADADAGACWDLHESSRRRAEVERGRGREGGGEAERLTRPLERAEGARGV